MEKSRMPKYLLIAVIGYIAVIIFIENFVVSSSFSILCLRTIDDVAFQASLNKYFGMHGADLLFMNDYGYGWIYWFPIYVITYPAYLLLNAGGASWPLIVLPRMQSFVFAVASSVLCYKIVSIYTKNEWIKAAVVFMMPLFPAGGYLAGRFGTVNQIAFFSMLSVYLVVKNDVLERKNLRYALWAFAVAMATKVSAVCMVPMLSMLILSRYEWKFTKENLRMWVQEIVLAVLLMCFLMSPAIVLAPLSYGNAKASISALAGYWKANQSRGRLAENLVGTLSFTMDKSLVVCLFLALLLLAAAGIIHRKEPDMKYRDYRMFPFGFMIGMLYLSFTIGSGVIDSFRFSTAISFIFPFGILVLEQFPVSKWKIQKVMIAVCAVCLCFMQGRFIYNQVKDGKPYNILRYFQENEDSSEKISRCRKMETAVEGLGLEQVNLYIDYQAPLTFYCVQEHHNLGNIRTIWDDMGSAFYEDVNVIVLSKHSIGFLEEHAFLSAISASDKTEQEKYENDKQVRNEIVYTGTYMGKSWRLIYEDEDSYIFCRK